MPTTRDLLPQEIEWYKSQGIDPTGFKAQIDEQSNLPGNQYSVPGAVAKTLEAHAGGSIGGGVGMLGGAMAMEASPLAHVFPPYSEAIAPIVGALVGGGALSWAGQKAQDKIQGPDVTERLNTEQAQASQEHPWATGITDFVAPMMIGGGAPAPSNLLKTGRLIGSLGKTIGTDAERAAFAKLGVNGVENPAVAEALAKRAGDVEAAKNVAMGGAVMPAINTGITYAQTGQLPDTKEQLLNIIGGSIMSGQNPLMKRFSPFKSTEVEQRNPSIKEPEIQQPATSKSGYTELGQDGRYVIPDNIIHSAYKELIPEVKKPESPTDSVGYKAYAQYKNQLGIPVEQKRMALEEASLKEQQTKPQINIPTTQPLVEAGIKKEAQDHPEIAAKQPEILPQIVKDELTGKDKEVYKKELEEELGSNEQKPNQRAIDFEKARQEKIAQDMKEQQNVPTDKPITENQARIINPTTLLNNDLNRPKTPVSDQTVKETGIKDNVSYAPKLNPQTETSGYKAPEIANKDKDYAYLKNPPIGKLGDMVRRVSEGNSPYNKLAKDLKLDKDSSDIPLYHNPDSNGAAYHTGNGTDLPEHIEVGVLPSHSEILESKHNTIDNTLTSQEAILHEAVHAGTIAKMPDWLSKADSGAQMKANLEHYLEHGDNPHVKEIIRCYTEAVKQLGHERKLFGKIDEKTGKILEKGMSHIDPDDVQKEIPDHGYQLANIKEFISGALTRKPFAEQLNMLSSGLGDNTSIWSRLKNAIAHLLGIHDVREGSLLERVLRPVEELSQQARKGEENVAGVRSNSPKLPPVKGDEEIPRAYSGGLINKFFRATLDRIRDLKHPDANMLADSIQRVHEQEDQYVGKFLNPTLKYNLSKVQDARVEAAGRYMLEHRDLKGAYTILRTPEERNAFNAIRKARSEMGDERIAIKEPVLQRDGTMRLLHKDEYDWHTTPAPKVVENIKEGKNLEEYKEAYVKYNVKLGMKEPEALDAWNKFKTAIHDLSSIKELGNEQFYNANRRAYYSKLPPEMTTQGALANFERYAHRSAADMAAYKHIESNNDVMSALGYKKTPWGEDLEPSKHEPIGGNPLVRTALGEIRGEATGTRGEYTEKGLSSVATTLFLGPGTTIHKLVSNVAKTVSNYARNPYQMGKIVQGMVTKRQQGIEHALENGVLKLTARSARDMFDSNLTSAERLQALAKSVRNIYNFGDLADKWNASLLQAGFESALPFRITGANKGDLSDMQLLRRLDTTWTKGKTYSPEEVSVLASRLAGHIHGTGDARTMPPWMLHDTELSGFFRLSNWGISQTNQFFNDVISPAKNGNWMPLINATFGAAIGGYMIKELREKLQGKKGQIPSLEEIASSSKGLEGNSGLLAYNLMAAASYAGFGGMLSTLGKIPLDKMYKNNSVGATFPLDEVASDLGNTLGQVTTAMANDPHFNWLHAAEHVMMHVMTTDVQVLRTAYNQAINAGLITGDLAQKKELSDKLGKLRRFDMTEGLPYNEQDVAGNPYMNMEQKAYKLEPDIQKAVTMLPGLINNIVRTYGSNPDVMMQKLKSLKENSYQTMPSLETLPLSFMKYMTYLDKLEGPGASQKALMDYMQHKVVNEVKSSVVP